MPRDAQLVNVTPPTSSGVATYPPGATFGPRAMRDFEFVWIIEGDAEYRWGAAEISAPAGAVVLCRPGETDFFRWDPKRRTRHAYFHFEVRSVPPWWPPRAVWPLVRVPGEGDILRPMFRHLLSWSAGGDAALGRLTTAHMLGCFVTGQIATRDVPRDALPEAVERATAWLTARLDEDSAARISLDDLAGAACVTAEHLCRMFKAATGHSPLQTVRLARLDRSAVLLARSNYSVREIAELCGFSSAFHFSRRFKESFGQSPRQLRTTLAAGAPPPAPRLLRLPEGARQDNRV